MADQCWFYRDDDEWNSIGERLKLIPCPHCKQTGALIRHGSLYGYDDSSPKRQTRRGRRIFCSNRNNRPGCGHTFTVWLADKIRRLSLTASSLWLFLQATLTSGIRAASSAFLHFLSHRSLQRIWRRFRLGQSKIRSALHNRCSPPEVPEQHQHAAQTLAHVRAAFPDAACPITAFQLQLRTFFV